MKAMVLAAGLGTRLRPLTNDRPKALVEVAGKSMLEIALERLRSFAIREVIINVHHHAEMIVEYLRAHHDFGMQIAISREADLLDTGGGLKHASWFFLENSPDPHEPFIVHNVDVISTIDLPSMVQFHREQNALATLAVQRRATSRPLLFDEQGRLRGRAEASTRASAPQTRGSAAQSRTVHEFGFAGIHVVSPHLFQKMHERGAFSIIETYLRLAAEGEKVVAFCADAYEWIDLGRPEHLANASRHLSRTSSLAGQTDKPGTS